MGQLVPFLVVAAVLAAILGALAWLASRVRRRGAGLDIAGPIDEIYRPNAHHCHLEIQVQERRMVPMPSPGDPWKRRRK